MIDPDRANMMKMCAAALLLALAGSPVEAMSITIVPSAGLEGNPAALASFNRAALQWSKLFADPIAVNISANLADLGNDRVIGSTSVVFLQGAYSEIRDAMVADAADESANAVVAYLPTAQQFSALVPAGFSLSADMVAAKANLKAMGFGDLDSYFGTNDGAITFNSRFSFDYDNADGVTPGTMDFETVAAHEIAHALGFVSVVDDIDDYISQNQTAPVSLQPLDLFRFNATAGQNPTSYANFTTTPRYLTTAGAAIFDDLSHEWQFSMGYYTSAEKHQASHWRADEHTGVYVGMMDPTLAGGAIQHITSADVRAFDLIGYDPVPEPGTLALVAGALLIVWRRARNRR